VPELPEVETMRRIVERELVGREVATIELRLAKLVRASPLPDLSAVVGRRVVAARRRAKVLVVDWSGGLSWLLHFKLAGQLAVFATSGERHVAGHPVPDPAGPYPHKATHVTVVFRDGTILYLSDVRQFGWLRMMPSDEVESALGAFGFGPEGTGAASISLAALTAALGRRRIPLKTALLDQAVVAGLGNIYVDEALHRARLHPTRPANSLTDDERGRLHEAISWSLERGIEQGGAKIVHGRAYPRDHFPAVHGRAGEPCFACATPIVKTRVGARGTYACPKCQGTSDE
jgi:formamidopyrimidine-DNA glycosylase